MRKTILGIAASAAIAIPLVVGGAADAAVMYDTTCTPVAATASTLKTLYKYSPVKSSEGPTQWAEKDAPAGTPATYVVKGKNVAYFRDGTKTSTVGVAGTEATTCGVKLSDPTGTRVNLPDVFEVEQKFDGLTYWSTQVAVTVTNDTAADREFRIRYADQQDGNRVWVERAIFTDGQPGNVVPTGSSRVMVFDVWYDVPSTTSDVPDDLILDFGFELG
ncbi:hypothetical protein [Microbacterium sp. SS28]|uniref:hypothetical protein n=1 Tax=Microbacterium sp. SS28 TaxID=2919948 RepID=UPI001FAA604A|nr:hypothetical protein [Microbacterium sp. SS28]